VPPGGQPRDILPNIVGVDAFAKIARAQGGVEVKGDSAVRDLDAAEDVNVEGKCADLFGGEVAQKIGILGAVRDIPGGDGGIGGSVEVGTRVCPGSIVVGLGEVPVAIVARYRRSRRIGARRGGTGGK
jgi:hypothetical protein